MEGGALEPEEQLGWRLGKVLDQPLHRHMLTHPLRRMQPLQLVDCLPLQLKDREEEDLQLPELQALHLDKAPDQQRRHRKGHLSSWEVERRLVRKQERARMKIYNVKENGQLYNDLSFRTAMSTEVLEIYLFFL